MFVSSYYGNVFSYQRLPPVASRAIVIFKYGRIREVGNKVGVPSSIHQRAVEQYEKYLYTPLHER